MFHGYTEEEALELLSMGLSIKLIRCGYQMFKNLDGKWCVELEERDSNCMRQLFIADTKEEALSKAALDGEFDPDSWMDQLK